MCDAVVCEPDAYGSYCTVPGIIHTGMLELGLYDTGDSTVNCDNCRNDFKYHLVVDQFKRAYLFRLQRHLVWKCHVHKMASYHSLRVLVTVFEHCNDNAAFVSHSCQSVMLCFVDVSALAPLVY
jgi:hypothetical protein